MKKNFLKCNLFEYDNKVLLIFLTIFFISFIFGSFYLFNCSNIINAEVPQIIYDFLIRDFLFLIVLFLLGYTVVGLPLLFFSNIILGIFCGITVSCFTYLFSFKGCMYYCIILYPYFFVFVISCFYVISSSLRLTVSLYNVFKEGTRYISPKVYSRPHIFKFVFLT